MDNDNTAAMKLKAYLDSGKSYYEASTLLQQEGLSSVQIEDAKIELDKQYGSQYQQAAHEAMIGQAEQTPASTVPVDDEDIQPERPFRSRSTPFGIGYLPNGTSAGTRLAVFIGALVILMVVYLIIIHLH